MLLALWGLIAGSAIGLLAGQQANLWNPADGWLLAAIVALGLQAFAPLARAGWKKARGDVTQQFQRNTYTTLGQAILELGRMGLQLEELGVSAFLVKRRMAVPWQQVLSRIGKVRFPGSPGPSRILWTKEKGVIGRCWKEENVVMKDTGAVHRDLLDGTEAAWNAASDETTLGLTYEEFRRIRGKYSAVVAVPIMSETEGRVAFRGCVAADVRWGGNIDPLFTTEAVEVLLDAAATIGNELTYVPSWALLE
jgi:hypothetical protein